MGLRSWLFGSALPAEPVTRAEMGIGSIEQAIPTRVQAPGSVQVDSESALKHSAVWASQRLRANLLSSLPVSVVRDRDGMPVEMPLPPVLRMPDGDPCSDLAEWLWATQFDLDRFGNCFGLITARDGYGLPAEIDLVPVGQVSVLANGGRPTGYRIGGKRHDVADVWHERQYRVPGMPVGLSPLTYAAYSISGYLSAQKFGLDFFGAGGMPAGVLKNTAQPIPDPTVTEEAKRRFKAATANRDIFVTGKDWEWSPAMSEGASMAFIEDKKYGLADVARYFDVPGDLIDVVQAGSAITYANISSRMTQLLVISMGPTIGRRERALSRLVPQPRKVQLDEEALLRMDPETRSRVLLARVAGRTLAPDEARFVNGLQPFTEAQMQQIERLLPTKIIAPRPETIA